MEETKKRGRQGGRAKGTPNKISRVTRELINELLSGEYERFKRELAELDAREFCKLYVDLIRYVTPTLKSVDVNETISHESTLAERLKRMAESGGQSE